MKKMVKSSTKKKIGGNEALLVVCPKCGQEFSLTDTLKHELEDELENRLKIETERITKETAEKVREEERKRISNEFKENEGKVKDLESKLVEANRKEVEFLKKSRDIDLKEKELPLKIEQEVETRRKEWEKNIEEIAKKSYESEISQLKLTIERQKKEVQDMQAKLTQGSQEAQGEIQELVLEETLRLLFPHDSIEPVPRGIKGADVTQTVRNSAGEVVGIIVWESKKTKNWSEKWIDKLIGDRDSVRGDIGVLMSETLPKDIKSFDLRKGIIIANFQLIDPIAHLLRGNLLKLFELKRANIDRTEKEGILYNFVLSNEFRSFMEGAALPVFNTLGDIQKEKATMERIWKKRETQLTNSLRNLIKLYGNISGIANLPEIPVFSADNDSRKGIPDDLSVSQDPQNSKSTDNSQGE
jgi:hypothetical protein